MDSLSVMHLLANPALAEMLNRAMESPVKQAEATQLMAECSTDMLVATAGRIRDLAKPKSITYSRKVFINLVNLCRDTCTYCTYKKEPGDPMLSMLKPEQVLAVAEAGRKLRCTEALFVTGERPEQKYSLAFVGYDAEDRASVLELTYNHGVERYDLGSAFGHIAIEVPDAATACEDVRRHGGKVTREAGPVKGGTSVIAFVEDPDGYKIEFIERKK